MSNHNTEILARIQDIVIELLGIDPQDVRPSSRLREDLEVDELDFIELIMEIEEEYGIEIPDSDLVASTAVTKGGKWRRHASTAVDVLAGEWKIKTVADLERYVARRLREG